MKEEQTLFSELLLSFRHVYVRFLECRNESSLNKMGLYISMYVYMHSNSRSSLTLERPLKLGVQIRGNWTRKKLGNLESGGRIKNPSEITEIDVSVQFTCNFTLPFSLTLCARKVQPQATNWPDYSWFEKQLTFLSPFSVSTTTTLTGRKCVIYLKLDLDLKYSQRDSFTFFSL